MTPEGVERRAEAVPPVRPRGDGLIALDIDRELFSMDAVLRSSYKFTDRCHIFIQTHETRMDRWTVVIRPKNADPNVIELAGDFYNELIDQRLREHHKLPRVLAYPACKCIDCRQKRGIPRHAQVDRRNPAVNFHRIHMMVQPVRRHLLVQDGVA